MAVAIGHIVELVGPDCPVRVRLRQFLGQPAGNLDVIIGVLVADGGDLQQFRPEDAQRILLLRLWVSGMTMTVR
jgi:hypothetical protein